MHFQIFPDYSDDEHFTINVFLPNVPAKNWGSCVLKCKQNVRRNLVLTQMFPFTKHTNLCIKSCSCPLIVLIYTLVIEMKIRFLFSLMSLKQFKNMLLKFVWLRQQLLNDHSYKKTLTWRGVVHTRMPWNTRNLLSFNIIEICSSYDFVHFLFNE